MVDRKNYMVKFMVNRKYLHFLLVIVIDAPQP